MKYINKFIKPTLPRPYRKIPMGSIVRRKTAKRIDYFEPLVVKKLPLIISDNQTGKKCDAFSVFPEILKLKNRDLNITRDTFRGCCNYFLCFFPTIFLETAEYAKSLNSILMLRDHHLRRFPQRRQIYFLGASGTV